MMLAKLQNDVPGVGSNLVRISIHASLQLMGLHANSAKAVVE